MERIIPLFRRAAEHASAAGVFMGFENHGGEVSGDPQRCAECAHPSHLPTYHLPTETMSRRDQFALTHVRGTLVRLCEAVGSAFFGVLYDPCNLMQAGTDYRAALQTFGPHITHVHLKDGFAARQRP